MIISRNHSLLVFLLTISFLATMTHNKVFRGGNEASRFAQIESLVDYGHTHIDESRYSWTVDKITLNGRNYSNKPPLLSVIGAGVYYLLKKTLGLTFAQNESAVVYLLTFILTGIPTAWLTALFYSSLARFSNISLRVRCLTTLALAAGTILTSFSVTLNNHTICAALIFAAFHSIWQGNSLRAGIWSALSVCIDIVPGLLFIPFFAYMLYHLSGRKTIIPYLTALIAGFAVFVATNLWIVNSPLPPKLVHGGIDHSSKFASAFGNVLLPDSWIYPLQCLFGWHGFFTVSPVLIFGMLGVGISLKKSYPLPLKICLLLVFELAVMIAGHIFLVGSYGGWSYGFRYLIPIIPIIMFFAPVIVERYTRIFTGLLAVSILFALIGAYHPWPPGYQIEPVKDPVTSVVTNPVGANASAWLQEYFPDLIVTNSMKSLFISPWEEIQIRYLILFYYNKSDKEMMDKMVHIFFTSSL